MELIKRVGKNLNNLYGVNFIENATIKSPAILCLSGDGIRDSKQANGFAKSVMTRLGVGDSQLPFHARIDDFDVYSVNYQGISMSDDDDYIRNLCTSYLGLTSKRPVKYKPNNKIENTVNEIYERVFKRLIFNLEDEIYSAKEISNNFSHLTVVNFCAGSVIMLGIEQKIYEDLKKHNIPEGQCVEIMKNLCTISLAPIVPIGLSRTSNVYFTSASDGSVVGMNGRHFIEEVPNTELPSLAQYESVKAYPNNNALVVCSGFGDVEDHYSENYTTANDVNESGKKLQMCFTKALAAMYSRKSSFDVKALAEDMKKMMDGDYKNAQEYALSSLKNADIVEISEQEWQASNELNKKYDELEDLSTSIKSAKRVPLQSNLKLSKNLEELKKVNSKYLDMVEKTLDALRKANSESNSEINERKDRFVNKKFASKIEMLEYYKNILNLELKKWRTNSQIIAATNELAVATLNLERPLSPEEEKVATTQYPSIEKFREGNQFMIDTSLKIIKNFINEQSAEDMIINE